LKRENELQDQLADKESSLSKAEEALQAARNELKELRDTHATTNRDSERLRSETEQLRMQVEKIEFETKEAAITMDSLKEANGELTTELDDVKHQLLDARMSAKESSAMLDEKERLKKERMAQMMAGFDLGDNMMSANELHVREMIQHVDNLLASSTDGAAIPAGELRTLRERLSETQSFVRQADINSSGNIDNTHSEILEQKLAQSRREYQELLERNLSEADIEEVKRSLHDSLSQQQNGHGSAAELGEAIARSQDENSRLRTELESLRKQSLQGANGATLNKQLADFDNMKKSLMRDLQDRCERVIELEINLDSTREQYNSILRSSNSKQQQKKLAFLERNLEQLTMVQRQLVEQNAQLKKEVAIAERKLVARGERIRGLEGLVQESQEKLMLANHKYVLQLAVCDTISPYANTPQIREPTHGRQRTSRSRQGRLYPRSRAQPTSDRQFRKQRLWTDRKASSRRRWWRGCRWGTADGTHVCWPAAGQPGRRLEQAKQLVFRQAHVKGSIPT
jgi:kinesin family protein 5